MIRGRSMTGPDWDEARLMWCQGMAGCLSGPAMPPPPPAPTGLEGTGALCSDVKQGVVKQVPQAPSSTTTCCLKHEYFTDCLRSQRVRRLRRQRRPDWPRLRKPATTNQPPVVSLFVFKTRRLFHFLMHNGGLASAIHCVSSRDISWPRRARLYGYRWGACRSCRRYSAS